MSYFAGPILREYYYPAGRRAKRRFASLTPEQRREQAIRAALTRAEKADTGRADAKLRKF